MGGAQGTQKVRSGAKLPLRATLSVYRDSSKKVTVPLTVAVPKKSKLERQPVGR